AAVAAARGGARVRLLELHGCLGGMWTSGLITWVIDSLHKPGIMAEIGARLDARGARYSRGRDYAYDAEAMKLLLEQMCLEAGVQVQMHTRVVAAAVERGRLRLAITESPSGREAWAAPVFIDATGNGDLAASAGCGYDLGRDDAAGPGGEMQPMSLLVLLSGLDAREIAAFISHPDQDHKEAKRLLTAEMQAAGVEPSYHGQTLFHLGGDLYSLSGNHQYGFSPLSAADITRATMQARAEMHRIVDALRARGGVWRNLRLVATAEQIGVRDGRRVRGRYTVTRDDLLAGASHADAVARVTVGIDVHTPDPQRNKTYSPENRTRTLPYDIPLRACIARDVEGLLMAGRCVSGDFLAHASYRMTATAAALGQGAGALAAVAALSGRAPHAVSWEDVRPAYERLIAEPLGAR
ncbi:MAG: FAD-dependent oxidoreductase, partial [Chloroflexota bacterium]